MGIKEIFRRRQHRWDAAHPAFAGAGSAQNLNEKLRTYLIWVKHEEPDEANGVTMDQIVQESAGHNEEVRECLDEIQRRYEEEVEAQRHELTQDELREGKQKDILKELSDLDLAKQLEGSSAFTPSSKEGPSSNPLMNQVGEELKRKAGLIRSPRIARVGGHRLPETVYNPADVDERKDSLQAEMEAAIFRLIPSSNYIIAEKIKKDYDAYLAHKLIQEELEMED